MMNFSMIMLIIFSLHFSNFKFLFYILFLMSNMMILLLNFSEFNSTTKPMIFQDYYSFMFIFLSYMILIYIYLLKYKNKNKNITILNSLIFFSLYFCFSSKNLIMFFIFFESSLIPLIFLILALGGSLERFKASLYLLIFTLSGSFLLLLMILNMKKNMNFNMAKLLIPMKNYSMMWLFSLIVFLIKAPMYSLHIWLPKAHVEAPVSGSMILAGILLKLGGFGLNRIFSFINLNSIKIINNVIILLSSVGASIVSIICLRQTDLKKMIAYSSVSHMSLIMSSMFTTSTMGMASGMSMMIAHGFCSSSFFYMGNIFYERVKTRNMLMYKGMMHTFPILSIFWMVTNVMNMSCPPSFNFFCEMFIIFSLMNKSLMLMIPISITLVMTVFYSLYMYMRICQGQIIMNFHLTNSNNLTIIIFISHLLFLIIFIIKMNLFLNMN